MLGGGGACAVLLPFPIQHLIVGIPILSKAKDLSALTQEHEHHKFPNDVIFLSKAKGPA